MATTIIRGGTIWTGGPDPELHERADLLIEDGAVAAIEPGTPAAPTSRSTPRAASSPRPRQLPHPRGLHAARARRRRGPRPARGRRLLPLGDPAARPHSYDRGPHDEFEAVMEWDAIAMLLGGATTVVEENFGGRRHLDRARRPARASAPSSASPTRATSTRSATSRTAGRATTRATSPRGSRRGLALHDEADGDHEGRLRVHLSPHASETVPEDVLRETRASAERARADDPPPPRPAPVRGPDDRRAPRRPSPVQLPRGDRLPRSGRARNTRDVHGRGRLGTIAATGTNVVHTAYRKAKEGLTSPYWEYVERGSTWPGHGLVLARPGRGREVSPRCSARCGKTPSAGPAPRTR